MYIEYAYQQNDFMVRNNFCGEQELLMNCYRKINIPNIDFYTSWCKYTTKDYYNGTMVGNLVFDFDSDNLKDVQNDCRRLWTWLRSIDIYNGVYCYFSGAKGFHLEIDYQLFNTEPLYNLSDIYKLLAHNMIRGLNLTTADTKIYEKRRLWRYPNTINSKTGLYCIQISWEQLQGSIEYILELAKSSQVTGFSTKLTLSKVLCKWFNLIRYQVVSNIYRGVVLDNNYSTIPCIEKILDVDIPKGKRNNMGFLVAIALKGMGMTKEKVLEILLNWLNKSDEKKMCETITYSVFSREYSLACKDTMLRDFCDKNNCDMIKKLKEIKLN